LQRQDDISNRFVNWASECPDVKNYKIWLNPVCTHMATVGVKGLKYTVKQLLLLAVLTWLILAGVCLDDAVVKPHVSDRHSVLCQRPGLVGADCRRRAQSLHCLKVLHQTVLTRHPLRRQRQADLDSHDLSRFCCETNWIYGMLQYSTVYKVIWGSMA